MSYNQQIQYVDYHKEGERLSTGGFGKMIQEGNRQRLELYISCKEETVSGEYEVWMIPEKDKQKSCLLGTISLEQGRGSLLSVVEGGKDRETVTLKIYLGSGRVLETCFHDYMLPKEKEVLQEGKERKREEPYKHMENAEPKMEKAREKGEYQTEEKYTEPEKEPEKGEHLAKEEYMKPEKEAEKGEYQVEEEYKESEMEKEAESGKCHTEEEYMKPEMEKEGANRNNRTEVKLSSLKDETGIRQDEKVGETKWEEIEGRYPGKSTFGDERKYIILTPSDFILLRNEDYRLVRNSFLVHNYSNYKELVLWKETKESEDSYYIGVKGIYDPRECRAAVYFGFERFECREEPPKVGEFGYYMKRVSL